MKKQNHMKLDSISARKLFIVDDRGNPRIVLSVDNSNRSGEVSTIKFLNEFGEPRLVLELANEGVRICVVPTETLPGIEIRRDEVASGVGVGGCIGEGSVAFLGQNPNPTLTNSPFKRGQGYLFVRDASTGNQINIPEPELLDGTLVDE